MPAARFDFPYVRFASVRPLSSAAKLRVGAAIGHVSHSADPEDLSARIKIDIAKWAEVIEKAGIPKK